MQTTVLLLVILGHLLIKVSLFNMSSACDINSISRVACCYWAKFVVAVCNGM